MKFTSIRYDIPIGKIILNLVFAFSYTLSSPPCCSTSCSTSFPTLFHLLHAVPPAFLHSFISSMLFHQLSYTLSSPKCCFLHSFISSMLLHQLSNSLSSPPRCSTSFLHSFISSTLLHQLSYTLLSPPCCSTSFLHSFIFHRFCFFKAILHIQIDCYIFSSSILGSFLLLYMLLLAFYKCFHVYTMFYMSLSDSTSCRRPYNVLQDRLAQAESPLHFVDALHIVLKACGLVWPNARWQTVSTIGVYSLCHWILWCQWGTMA